MTMNQNRMASVTINLTLGNSCPMGNEEVAKVEAQALNSEEKTRPHD